MTAELEAVFDRVSKDYTKSVLRGDVVFAFKVPAKFTNVFKEDVIRDIINDKLESFYGTMIEDRDEEWSFTIIHFNSGHIGSTKAFDDAIETCPTVPPPVDPVKPPST